MMSIIHMYSFSRARQALSFLPVNEEACRATWSGVWYEVCEDSKVAFDRLYRHYVNKYEDLGRD